MCGHHLDNIWRFEEEEDYGCSYICCSRRLSMCFVYGVFPHRKCKWIFSVPKLLSQCNRKELGKAKWFWSRNAVGFFCVMHPWMLTFGGMSCRGISIGYRGFWVGHSRWMQQWKEHHHNHMVIYLLQLVDTPCPWGRVTEYLSFESGARLFWLRWAAVGIVGVACVLGSYFVASLGV